MLSKTLTLRGLRTRPRPGVPELRCHAVGDALMVCTDEGPHPELEHWARQLPGDPERVVVVIDVPRLANPWTWEGVVQALRGKGAIRLAGSKTGAGDAAPAQWLADRLGVEVVAPDGPVTVVPGGSLFVENGRWRSFRSAAPASDLTSTFPALRWEPYLPVEPVRVPAGLVLDRVPCGLWLHRGATAFRHTVYELPCRGESLTMVVGARGEAPLESSEIAALLRTLPERTRELIRLAPFGAQPSGQEIADAAGFPVIAYTGLPVCGEDGGVEIVTIGEDGEVCTRPFASHMRCSPASTWNPAWPEVLGCRVPVPGLRQISPNVFSLGGKHVVEVVQSGLWIRGGQESADAGGVRTAPPDPNWTRVTCSGDDHDGSLARVVVGLNARFDPLTQQQARFVFAGQQEVPRVVEDLDDAVSPLKTERQLETKSTWTDDLSTRTIRTKIEKRHLVVQAVPEAVAVDDVDEAVTPEIEVERDFEPLHHTDLIDRDYSSTPEDRAWLRRVLGPRYDVCASSVLRVLSKQPGLRAVEGDSLESVVADLVAVQVYLGPGGRQVDAALRTGGSNELRTFACCLISGLARLPSYRGIVYHGGADGIDVHKYVPGTVLTDPGFLNAAGSAKIDGLELVLWSFTGRRVEDADPNAAQQAQRIVFPPGTRFEVLGIDGRRVLLREVVEERRGRSDNQDGVLLERLRKAAVDGPVLSGPTHLWAFGGLSHRVGQDEQQMRASA